jgi:DNA polymerase-3 subunit delta
MKLTYLQLASHLNQSLASIYLLSGDELLLKQEAIYAIRKAAKLAGFCERIRLTKDAGFEWEQLYLSLYSLSLFAEKRLLELDLRDTTPNQTASAVLKEYALQPNAENILLIDMGKIDDKIAKSAWYRALEKSGIVITIWPIPREQFPQWIIQRAKRYKLSLQQDGAYLISDYVEGNLVAAAQVIEKLYLLAAQAEISLDMIQSILADESRFTIFDFIDSFIALDASRTLHILESLRMNGTDPTLILWGITRELRMLATLSQDIKQGQSCEMLFQKHRIFSRRQPLVRQFLNRIPLKDCFHGISLAGEMDKLIKGAIPGNIWHSLQLFCVRFNLPSGKRV